MFIACAQYFVKAPLLHLCNKLTTSSIFEYDPINLAQLFFWALSLPFYADLLSSIRFVGEHQHTFLRALFNVQ